MATPYVRSRDRRCVKELPRSRSCDRKLDRKGAARAGRSPGRPRLVLGSQPPAAPPPWPDPGLGAPSALRVSSRLVGEWLRVHLADGPAALVFEGEADEV